jgi:hypothetical protein
VRIEACGPTIYPSASSYWHSTVGSNAVSRRSSNSSDFFAVEVWAVRGLCAYYVLFFLDLPTWRVHVAGITRNPNDRFMAQAAA